MYASVYWTLALAGTVALAFSPPDMPGNMTSSPDGTCGGTTGYTCYGSFFGNCCRVDGKCSSTETACGAGCQLKFGFCSDTKGKISPFGRCGGELGFVCQGSGFGDCCSAYGFCGTGAPYCGSGCQKRFGSCENPKQNLTKRAIDCPSADGSIYTSSSGDTFAVECGVDHPGGDVPGGATYVSSLGACLDLCSQTSGCVDASWLKGSPRGPCYLKKTLKAAKQNDKVQGGRLLSKATLSSTTTSADATTTSSGTQTSPSSVAGASTTTTTAVATTKTTGASTSSTSSTTTSSAQPSVCPGLNGTVYVDTCGANYRVECGIDHSGGDLSSSYTDGYGSCVDLCSKTSGCVGAAWVKGSPRGPCYLKKTIKPVKADSKVWGALRLSNCTTSSSSATSSGATGNATVSGTSSATSAATFSTVTTTSASLTPSNSANVTSSSTSSSSSNSSTATTCGTVAVPTSGVLANCTRCDGQPGNDQFCGFDINTNWYENTPKTCRVVTYNFEITNTTIAPDGISRLALLVNGQMPGPTLRASWGDTVVVRVTNRLQDNGTSIHFHGIRQLNNNMNDGVPSITQCPIAPGASMTYTFVADNYGTSWYHSHYAIQAWEGVFGPVIIDGPHSASFDEDAGTFLLQDWTHQTVDSMYDLAQNATPIPGRTDGATFGGPQTMDTGLINGMNVFGVDGTANQTGKRLEIQFEPGKSYLLRLVNTAIQSTYKFSIDGHTMTVISADFVPIQPYQTDVLAINIGQRYNVIVHANATAGNYWMRADNQESCAHTVQNRDIKAVVRYTNSGPSDTSLPTSTSFNYTDSCVDEPYASLVPIVALNAGPADFTEGALDVLVRPNEVQLYKWYLSGTTFASRYDDPTLLDIYRNDSVPTYSGNLLVEIPQKGQMVYIIIESPIPLPHPLHLHGHDFWILAEGSGTYDSSVTLNLVNPPRRDTVLMPAAGFVVVAFVTDNPGVWLFHCHIGWHTSMGFALQIVEMQEQIKSSGALANSCTLNDTCAAWLEYAPAEKNLTMLDSGV